MASRNRSSLIHDLALLAFAAFSPCQDRPAQAPPRQDPPAQDPPSKEPSIPPQQAEASRRDQPKSEWNGDPYLLELDPVTRTSLGPVARQEKRLYQGREFRFASLKNAETFEANPSSYIPAVDARLIRDQSDFYPLETCLVTGEPLGEKPVSFIHRNRLVRLSSQQQVAVFKADTGKYIEALDKAVIEKQGPGYPEKTCAACSKTFGDGLAAPIDYVIGNRLIRVCSEKCRKDIERDPRKYMDEYPSKAQRKRTEKPAEPTANGEKPAEGGDGPR